jgi:hypothetical protein
MKKIMAMAAAAFGREVVAGKDIQYRYVFVPPACGGSFSAVCVG